MAPPPRNKELPSTISLQISNVGQYSRAEPNNMIPTFLLKKQTFLVTLPELCAAKDDEEEDDYVQHGERRTRNWFRQ